MKTSGIFLSAIAILLQNALRIEGASSVSSRPNIVFILVDDLGWNDVSFHGSSQIPAPNIDTLALDGVILNNYYVQPMCTPSRSSLMSGRYPIHTGMQHYAILNHEPWGLPLNITILPQWLKKLGYDTHIVGKWHLGFHKKEYTPTYRGFDSHFGSWGSHQDYYTRIAVSGDFYGYDFRSNMTVTVHGYKKYSTTLFTDKAAEVIKKQNTSQPLFLYLAYHAVHAANAYNPLQVPAKYREPFKHISDQKRKTYAGMVAALDDGIGRIVQSLYEKDMLDNTIIVFSTDNGGSPSNKRFTNSGSNWPLRGTKRMLWEGGIRGAAFAWSPLFRKRSGWVSNYLMHISDWLPTLYEAAGGNVKDLGNIDGVSLWNTLRYNITPDRIELLHNIDPDGNYAAIRVGDYKLITGVPPEEKNDWYGPSGRERRFNSYTPEYEYWTASATLRQFYLNQCIRKGSFYCSHNLRTWTTSRKRAEILCDEDLENKISSACDTTKQPCLFNIAKDPCERINLAHDHPKIVRFLLSRLQWYNNTAVPIRNRPSDPKSNPALHESYWTNWKDVQCSSSDAECED